MTDTLSRLFAGELLAKIHVGDYEGEDCQKVLDRIVKEYPDLEACIFGPEDRLDERMPGGKRKKAPDEPGAAAIAGIAKSVREATQDVQGLVEGLKAKSAPRKPTDVPDLVREASSRELSGDGVMQMVGLGPKPIPAREFSAMERAAFGLPGGLNLRGKGPKPPLKAKCGCRKRPCRCDLAMSPYHRPKETVYQGRRR